MFDKLILIIACACIIVDKAVFERSQDYYIVSGEKEGLFQKLVILQPGSTTPNTAKSFPGKKNLIT